jgi:hypothetical protein
MPGLVPGIHVLLNAAKDQTWMAGTSPAMTRRTSPAMTRREAFASRRGNYATSSNLSGSSSLHAAQKPCSNREPAPSPAIITG